MSKKFVYLFAEGNESMRELLGGKGANLAEMSNLGMPVPYGFTITTEACNCLLYTSGLCFAVDDQMYHTHIYGAFQAMNLTAVIAVCSLIKMEKNQIRQCIENLLPLSGRMQKIWQDPLVFIDYAHTASACMALFNTVRRLPHDKIITVIGCGGERDEQKRSVMGRLASEASTLCILSLIHI